MEVTYRKRNVCGLGLWRPVQPELTADPRPRNAGCACGGSVPTSPAPRRGRGGAVLTGLRLQSRRAMGRKGLGHTSVRASGPLSSFCLPCESQRALQCGPARRGDLVLPSGVSPQSSLPGGPETREVPPLSLSASLSPASICPRGKAPTRRVSSGWLPPLPQGRAWFCTRTPQQSEGQGGHTLVGRDSGRSYSSWSLNVLCPYVSERDTNCPC